MKKLTIILSAFIFSISALTLFSKNAGDETVTVCHKRGNTYVTMEVPENALNGHLAHGDILGGCERTSDSEEVILDEVSLEETPIVGDYQVISDEN